MKVLECIGFICLSPLFLAFFAVFFALWAVWTCTGIGPLAQCYFSARDNVTLSSSNVMRGRANMRTIVVPGDVHTCSRGKPYNIFAVFSEPAAQSRYPPVCIPNGLGANVVLISKMQEALVAAGFAVLSFDRLGVGLSDENTSKVPPTASDVVREMEFVMNSVLPVSTKWILLGPSMGSIVAQCYIAEHPDKVIGFLNMDGLPYPFIKQSNMFEWAGFIYRIYASIVWTGILRPFLYMARLDLLRMFGSKEFSIEIILALMNQRRFFANVALEMLTMMDCCAMAERAWGDQSLLKLSTGDLQTLVCVPPDESVDFTPLPGAGSTSTATTTSEHRALTSARSPSESGDRWSSADEVRQVLAHLRAASGTSGALSAHETSALVPNASVRQVRLDGLSTGEVIAGAATSGYMSSGTGGATLASVWPGLVVRVMSARSHDFGNAVANSFYNQEMRDLAAAEHAKHTLCARDGKRTVYPHITHTAMFTKTGEIVDNMVEIAEILTRKL